MTVEQILAELKGYTADLPKIAADYSTRSADIKKIQTGFAAGAQTVTAQAGAIDAKYNVSKAQLKAQYEAELKKLEAAQKTEHVTLSNSAEGIFKKHIGSLDLPVLILEITSLSKGFKMMADECAKALKDLPKAAGSGAAKKEALALADKTGKALLAQQKQWAALGESAQKTVAAFNVSLGQSKSIAKDYH